MENNSQNISQAPVQDTPSEQIQTAPPSSAINKPKSKLPLLIIGIVIFLLIVSAVSAAFFILPKSEPNQNEQTNTLITPQPTKATSPSSNTKTFTNNEYGYSFSYPNNNFQIGQYDNQILQESPTEGKYMYVYGCLPACEAYSSGFGVYSFENLNKWDLNTWSSSSAKAPLRKSDNQLDNLLTECINKDPRTKKTSGTFQGKNSITLEFAIDAETVKMKNKGICNKETFIGGGGGHQKWIILDNKGEIIAIQINHTDENEKAQIEKILSSFKLTN